MLVFGEAVGRDKPWWVQILITLGYLVALGVLAALVIVLLVVLL